MSPARRRAYTLLLYRGLVDIRGQCWGAMNAPLWNPLRWSRLGAAVRRIELIADALHNLPDSVARDFEGFDEAFFWASFVDANAQQDPGSPLAGYRAYFEAQLTADAPP